MSSERIVPFTSGDGMACQLIHVRGEHPPRRGSVLLVHGAGVRANIFRPPSTPNFVDYLVAQGFDVWLENWRASIDLPLNRWTLDQAALYDHPAAVATVLRETGAARLKAVIHCQGSTSFMMSVVAGLVPQVDTIISSAVSLHPRVSRLAYWKCRLGPSILSRLTPYLDAQWGDRPEGHLARTMRTWVNLAHRECDNDVCKFSSFMFGVGHPVLWSHEHLDDAVHDWLRHEVGKVPMSFFEQMKECLNAGHLVCAEALPGLPRDLVTQKPLSSARICFITGRNNRCFDWRSQEDSYAYFSRLRPEFHSLHVFEEYGHLDVFLGRHAARDVFPLLLAELEKPGG